MRRTTRLAVAVIALCLGSPAFAQSTPPPSGSDATSTAPAPWSHARQVLEAAQADVHRDGLRALEPRVPDLEKALADADDNFPRVTSGDTVYVLADGMAEALVVSAAAASDKTDGAKAHVAAVPNPYPVISLYLGSYYNEIGKADEALRVLDHGIKLSAVPDMRLGETLPYLISERGAAFNALKRYDDALDAYDDGLKIESLKDPDRARFFRGRGFALTQLNRLDDAEEAYNNSLKLDPGNPTALNELKYIAQIRAGGLQEPGRIFLPGGQKSQ